MRHFIPIAIVLGLSVQVYAQTAPTGFTVDLYGGSGLTGGTAMAFTPDGRLLVCQQSGTIRIIKNGAYLPTAFHTAQNVDNPLHGQRGLLGIAVDPDFTSTGYVYIYVTTSGASTSHNEVRRLRVTPPGGDVSDGSELAIITLEDVTSSTHHNGGGLAFGSDGKLFVAVGDNDNPANAQSITSRFGKILRYNADGSIPGDNPASFPGISGATSGEFRAIWAVGMSNPWRIAFQPGTMHYHINEPGANNWDEVNEGQGGVNYGWEGGSTDGSRGLPDFTDPVFSYNRTSGTPMGSALTGGVFYNPSTVQFPASYLGKYFISDFVSGWIFATDSGGHGAATQFLVGASGPVDLAVGPDGALYYLSMTGSAGVYRVSYGSSAGTGSSSSSSGSDDKCGATGFEALVMLGIVALARKCLK